MQNQGCGSDIEMFQKIRAIECCILLIFRKHYILFGTILDFKTNRRKRSGRPTLFFTRPG